MTIGRLGSFSFPDGYYTYAGSARGPGGLKARLNRHLGDRKQLRWHIDYLLREARVQQIWKAFSHEKLECLWTRALLRMLHASIPVPRFGSSDCDCETHLVHFTSLPSPQTFANQLQTLGGRPSLLEEMLGEQASEGCGVTDAARDLQKSRSRAFPFLTRPHIE
jgi:Uri superfamily endonuclease